MFTIKSSSRQRRSFQPVLENLEDRCVPAGMSTPQVQLPAVQYNDLPAVQYTDHLVPSSNLALQMYSNWLPAFQPADAGFAGAQPLGLTKPAVNGIILPAGTPGKSDNILFPDFAKVGPQPIPPTKSASLFPAVQAKVMINPQPEPPINPAQVDWLKAMPEDPKGIILPAGAPKDLVSMLLPNFSPKDDIVKAGPQPIPPTKSASLFPAVQAKAMIDPQPQPPINSAQMGRLKAMPEDPVLGQGKLGAANGIILPAGAPKDFISMLLPNFSQKDKVVSPYPWAMK